MKNKSVKKLFAYLAIFVLVLNLTGCGFKADEPVTVLYTNDIHSYMDNEEGLTYAHLAQMKKDLTEQGENVIAADAGDHIQGSVYGTMDSGETVIKMMNGIYDVATIGNHEFDYGMDHILNLTENSAFPYLSCNFVREEDNNTVLDASKIIKIKGVKVGFLGITTPETITSSAPVYFQDDSGNYIYDILKGEELYNAVQASIDSLKKQGADYIIALGHLGVDESSEYSSYNVIANVSGLDAFIDGHSHTEMEKEIVKDKSGEEVLLTQTGQYFGAIGKMTLKDGNVDTVLIKEYDKLDKETEEIKNDWVEAVNKKLGTKVATLNTTLSTGDKDGNRLVRVAETNLGDFVADAYYYYINDVEKINCDVAFINGGGLRADINAGEVSSLDFKETNPFGNVLCVVSLSGQQILDALEWGARITSGKAGENESGAFLHTAGLTYKINTSIKSTVGEADEIWVSSPSGEHRVTDVKVYDRAQGEYVDLDLQKKYSVVGANYTLRNMGDGFAMLEGELVKDYIVEDYMALVSYADAFEDNVICSENSPLQNQKGFLINYENTSGAGRVEIK